MSQGHPCRCEHGGGGFAKGWGDPPWGVPIPTPGAEETRACLIG